MKKVLSVFLILITVFSMSIASADESFSLSYFTSEEMQDTYVVTESKSDKVTYIESTVFTFKDCNFTHKYKNPRYYSALEADMVVLNYTSKSSAYPILRFWIYFATTQLVHVTSVSFVLDEKAYTFYNVDDLDNIYLLENGGYEEDLLIRFGESSFDAVIDLYNYAKRVKDQKNGELKMILHGVEDLEVSLNTASLTDIYTVIDGYIRSYGFRLAGKEKEANYMTVTSLK